MTKLPDADSDATEARLCPRRCGQQRNAAWIAYYDGIMATVAVMRLGCAWLTCGRGRGP